MTQPLMPPPGGAYPTPPQNAFPPPMTPPAKRPPWFTSKPFIGIAAGVLGLALGAGATGSDSSTSATPSPTVTVTVPGDAAPAEEPEPAEEPSQTATFNPKKSDFKLGIKILTKSCFGSAGCNVTFRIKPTHVGAQPLPESGTVEVTYKIKGGDDPKSNTFTIQDGQASYHSEEHIGTASSSSKLTAVVTDVAYNEW